MGEKDIVSASTVAVTEAASSSSDRRQWQRIFASLVEMLRGQQSQIETLAGDRKFLESYIHSQHDRWVNKTRLLQSHISQMKLEEEMVRKAQAAKMEVLLGMKERETACYKEQYEHAKIDLEDFRECIETLGLQISELKRNIELDKGKKRDGDVSAAENSKGEETHVAALEGEMKKLKHAYKKLVSTKEAEISALLAEKDFIWNQFKKVDEDCTSLRKSKRLELEQSTEALEKLQSTIEKLQSSASEKDEIIVNLRSDVAWLKQELGKCSKEAEQASEKLVKLRIDMEELRTSTNEKDETIDKLRNHIAKNEMNTSRCNSRKSRFLKERGSSKRLKSSSASPAGKHLRVVSVKPSMEYGSSGVAQKRVRVFSGQQGSHASTASKGLQRCSRYKERSISTPESPRLFSATFKVPKLKDLSSSLS